jgi:hypothetical protein
MYNAIIHTYRFGQVYCKFLLKRILRKFILHFFEFYIIYYEFSKIKRISWKLNRKRKLEKEKMLNSAWAETGPRPCTAGLAWVAQAISAVCARPGAVTAPGADAVARGWLSLGSVFIYCTPAMRGRH